MGIDAARYRQIIGHFATGVTVVTMAIDGWLHGITVNALASASLDPMLLLICIDKQAHAHQQLSRAGHFGVNVLTEEQEALARLFAVSGPPQRGSLRGAAYHRGPRGMPVLEDCLAYLECAMADRCAGGDHTIFIGEVLGGEVVRQAPPLLFYRGGYRRLPG